MKIKHLFFVMVIFVFYLTGCSLATIGNDQPTEENINDFPQTMIGYIKINGKRHEMKAGNYKWERKVGSETEVVTTDAASPSQIGESFNAIEVEPSADVAIEIKDKPKLSVYQWNEASRDKEIILENDHLSVPSNKGRYIYEVLAKWSNGEVSYTFVVEVN